MPCQHPIQERLRAGQIWAKYGPWLINGASDAIRWDAGKTPPVLRDSLFPILPPQAGGAAPVTAPPVPDRKFKIADLYCKAGGAGMGYHQAGFDVVGYDIEPQKRYPFEFRRRDVLALTPEELREEFDAIHASPPCQADTSLKHMPNARKHANLAAPTRALLQASGLPYIIEGVRGAPLHGGMLCGTMFGLGSEDAELQRHRLFETSWFLFGWPECQHGARGVIGLYGGHTRNRKRQSVIGVYGHGPSNARGGSRRAPDKGVDGFNMEQGREAMGIAWMTQAELSQAIPPAYTKWLGHHLLAELALAAA